MTPDPGITALAGRAFADSERGDVTRLGGALTALAGVSDPPCRAWRHCLTAVRWIFDPAQGPPPTREDLTVFADASGEARVAAAEACAIMARAGLLAFDRGEVAAWTDLHRILAPPHDAAAPIRARAGALWVHVLEGQTAACEADAAALVKEASETRVAPVVVEATALMALGAWARGDLHEAVEVARRAARMAQAEDLLQPSCLAHLVLARMRRLSGRPHLALHILTALARVAPPLWQPWLAWEMLLAGGERSAPGLVPYALGRGTLDAWRSTRASRALRVALETARLGDRASFERAADEIPAALGAFRDLVDEAQVLRSLLEPTGAAPSAEAASWCRGGSAQTPLGLHALGARDGSDDRDGGVVGYVLAVPGRPGRRLLGRGVALLADARHLETDGSPEGAGVRTDTALAALGLAGPSGLTRQEFFREVYLFAFVPEMHQGNLDLLVLRMRRRLGGLGEIDRRDDHVLVLRTHQPLLVPDARCVVPTADRTLRALAAAGPVTADEAAKKLGISSRTIHRVLQQLLEEGAVTQERTGRHVAYRVHDTTFTQVNVSER